MLLLLPLSTRSGEVPALVTAVFTSASAVTVTGLTLVDTGTYWSGFGQAVILLLIQLGALGFMTGAIIVFRAIGRHFSARDRDAMALTVGSRRFGSTFGLAVRITVFALAFELVGWGLLYVEMLRRGSAAPLWPSLFHAVSAFANAGFDVFGHDDSLMGFRDDPFFLGLTAILIIAGGLGFLVFADLGRVRKAVMWDINTKIILSLTAAFLVLGAVGFLVLESGNPATLGNEGFGERLRDSTFTSVSARTAGFTTVDMSEIRPETQTFLEVLMLVGGAPGSAAGGIKLVTVGAILAALRAAVSGRGDVELFGRRLQPRQVARALAVLAASTILIGIIMVVIGLAVGAGPADFEAIQFEATSAFAEVGFSTGIVRHLPALAVMLISGLMFVGRLGPLTLMAALAVRHGANRYQYPEGQLRLG